MRTSTSRATRSPVATGAIAGPPLGALDGYPFTSARQQLERGDLLCLFTDGVSEAGDRQHMFGTERLASTLLATAADAPLAARATAIRDAVRRFEAGRPPCDDLTVLLAEWYGRPPNER